MKLFILIISKRKRGRFWKILEHTIWKTLGSDTSFLPLTRWGRVTYIWVIKLSHHCFRSRLVAWPVPSHYLNKCWNFVNYILGIKFQWNFAQKTPQFSYKKMRLKISFGKWRPFCLGLNVLRCCKLHCTSSRVFLNVVCVQFGRHASVNSRLPWAFNSITTIHNAKY